MKKAYFFVNPLGPPNAADYQHCVISFAEGLKDLGIQIEANINYYKIIDEEVTENYLFNQKKIDNIDDYNNYDIIVTGYTAGIPKNIIRNKNRTYKTIMLDWSDGLYTHIKKNNVLDPTAGNYDLYFITSYNKVLLKSFHIISKNHILKYSNVYPLAFSLTHRIIDTIQDLDKNNNFSDRKHQLLYPHRVNHYIRHFMLKNYNQYSGLITMYNDNFNNPKEGTIEYQHWHQSGRRHSLNFYNTLLNTKICDCTGGYIFIAHNKYYASQVDSFKLWEAFASGCAVITIDFDRYNIELPHQPKNGVHYIGITNNEQEVRSIINKIINSEIDIEKIASEGKKWALKHYSPKGLANYILSKI